MSYERLESCPVCGKTEFRNKLVVEDRTVSHESFAIVQCAGCSFQFTNPRPDEADIGRYYESDDYVSHNSGAAGLVNRAYKVARFFTMRRKVGLLTKFAPRRGKLLDYGCGTGNFLAAAKSAGWDVAGFEPNARAREEASQRLGQPIGQDGLGALEPGTFDAITLWHVLEHVHTLNETLAQLAALLKPDGVMLIAVPNVESLDAQHYRELWAAYDVPRHLYHFAPKTMAQPAQEAQAGHPRNLAHAAGCLLREHAQRKAQGRAGRRPAHRSEGGLQVQPVRRAARGTVLEPAIRGRTTHSGGLRRLANGEKPG
ncbi:class I SAM-dependent methyltransferase [Hymenobacter humi]|uniref:Class I SAM-dependent methyltransferase n=1 Tax=Hymenobacter humi TaxID=1411620 RepID=A0ABW2U1A5_9BACT